jgi:hypothetical protein
MKYLHALMILTLFVAAPAHSQSDLRFDPKLSDRENIKAERAKAVAEQAKSDRARPWDRDKNGKRPWEVVQPSTTK